MNPLEGLPGHRQGTLYRNCINQLASEICPTVIPVLKCFTQSNNIYQLTRHVPQFRKKNTTQQNIKILKIDILAEFKKNSWT